MAIDLTDKFCAAAKAPEGRRGSFADSDVRGLELRVTQAGAKSWAFRYRAPDGATRRLTLGTYATPDGSRRADEGPDEIRPLTLSEARKSARAARAMVDRGKDPFVEKATAKAVARIKGRTFDDLVTTYWTACETGVWTPRSKVKRARTLADERNVYRLHLAKALGPVRVDAIARATIRDALTAMRQKGIGAQTNKAQQVIRQAFAYALDQGWVGANPALGLKLQAPIKTRGRLLKDDEMKGLWQGLCRPDSLPARPSLKGRARRGGRAGRAMAIAVMLCALLLQRRNEIAGMRRTELDLEHGVWTIPGERMKGGKPHMVPLSARAIELITEALTLAGNSPCVFPGARDSEVPVLPDSVTHALAWAIKALGFDNAGPHDLRRTGATTLTSERLGFSPFVVSQVLGHSSDAGGGAAVTMNHYVVSKWMTEKRAALNAWESLLLEIVGERTRDRNVVPLIAAS